ncbi:ABC transporter ATP-binding protein [Haloarcula amylolytica]|uniref:Probable branched-chain amino acid transport ATP-binding protein LivG n=1 Tax=Haloarcula amylolytica JCM 13557 TaxID=1227452 RepID=M0KZ53_9EURY|nr:ABC transporter ATP-binding protein [Haloarcula amylolytica]EMA26128.1 branched-chain amino acid ABC transporter ATP-binding protein [Haloarcula amylolytica JCM 13557]
MSEQSLVSDGPILGKEDPVLRAEGLEKRFGGLVATDDASIEVERGTITGLIGPNGAGKSTLFNLVSGFYEPDAGSVAVNGVDVTGKKPHQIADQGMIRTFQTPRKPEGMTVREALLVGPHNQTGESIIPLFTSPDTVEQEERRSLEQAQQMLERFEIGDLATQPATDLSGGQMKLVELARGMMAEPDLLLLDEPVAGVNPVLADKLAGFIEELNEEGITFLIIEHDMNFIMRLADPIIVLNQGSVLVEGPPEAVRSDERVIDAYLGGPSE